MPVFFVHSHAIHHHTVTIQGPLHTHLTKSLRYRPGDVLWCGDEQRERYQIRITSSSTRSLEGTILARQSGPPPPPVSIVLGLSILKGEHMNWAVQKATELGVHTIVPLIAQRCVVRPDIGRGSSYQERWQRIACDAAQQSERWDVPHLELPCPIATFLETHQNEKLTYILVERGQSDGIGTLFLSSRPEGALVMIIGPEGGWTEEERAKANRCQFTEVTLGKTIFRAETASLVVLTLIQNQLGYLG